MIQYFHRSDPDFLAHLCSVVFIEHTGAKYSEDSVYDDFFPLTDFSLIDPQALQAQMAGHQTAIDTLRKAAESLKTSDGDLLSNSDEIQETVGERERQRDDFVASYLCIFKVQINSPSARDLLF